MAHSEQWQIRINEGVRRRRLIFSPSQEDAVFVDATSVLAAGALAAGDSR